MRLLYYLRYHAHTMKFLGSSRIFGTKVEDLPALVPTLVEEAQEAVAELLPEDAESTVMRTLAWVTAAVGALALGLYVGRELRLRYKFNHRTPYDFYAHSGDESEMEYSVGI